MDTTTIEQIAQFARTLFEGGDFMCAESTLLALAESQDIESDIIPDIATGFCGGMARTCGVCGAVTGSMMGLSLIAGKKGADRAATYAITQQFLRDFKARFGSINCPDLTNCDLGTPEGQAKFKAEDIFAHCLDYVTIATQLALAAANALDTPSTSV